MMEEISADEFIELRRQIEKTLPTRSSVPDDISVDGFFRVLHESEERHRIISELTSDYIYSMVVYSNRTVETNWMSGAVQCITGYTMEEIRNLEGGWYNVPQKLDTKIGE